MRHALQMQIQAHDRIARMRIAQEGDAADKRKQRGKDKKIGKRQRLRPAAYASRRRSPVMLLAAMAPS